MGVAAYQPAASEVDVQAEVVGRFVVFVQHLLVGGVEPVAGGFCFVEVGRGVCAAVGAAGRCVVVGVVGGIDEGVDEFVEIFAVEEDFVLLEDGA